MAVPGQDERDWEFAEKFDLPIIRTVQPPEDFEGKAYTGEGEAINSDFLNGLGIEDAKEKIIDFLEDKGAGKKAVNYKLRDWLFSRQRYWGEPFPIVWISEGDWDLFEKSLESPFREFLPEVVDSYTNDSGVRWYALPLPEASLPLTLPEVEEFDPTGQMTGVLGKQDAWHNIWLDLKSGEVYPYLEEYSSDYDLREVPKPNKWCVRAVRETNTMPQWAGSCWYYLRYISPEFDGGPVDPDYEKYWMPVDLYVGGAEHAVLHLLYARFWHKVLYDIGVVSTKEPFNKLVNQGMILGEMEFTGPDGKKISEDKVEKKGEGFVLKGTDTKVEARAHKMSKSRGNVINPDHIIDQYGADSLRLYEMFMGPLEQVKPWSTKGVEGVNRFLNRAWRLLVDEGSGEISDKVKEMDAEKKHLKPLHEAIKKVGEDIEGLRFNTAISALMIFVNEANNWDEIPVSVAGEFIQILNPFAPHITEELWRMMGNDDTLAYVEWPEFNEEYLKADSITYPVQVNGKVRADIEVDADKAKDKDYVLGLAKEEENVAKYLADGNLVKEIFVPGKIVNLVVK